MAISHPKTKKIFLDGIMTNTTLCPNLNPSACTVSLLICFFAWNIETTNHRDKQNLTKTRLMCWLIVLGFLNQNPFKKATKQLFYHPLKKDDVANVGLKR